MGSLSLARLQDAVDSDSHQRPVVALKDMKCVWS